MLLSDSKTKNTSRSILWGGINKIAGILLSFAVRTEIIYFLGVEYTGLGSLFNSILTVLSLAELGFGSALVFSMYKPVAENDVDKVNAYLNFYKKCYRVIGIVIFVVGVLAIPVLPHLINGYIPDNINIFVLYGLYLLNTVLSYCMFVYKISIFVASQRNDIVSNISTAVLIATNIIQVILLALFRNYYAYVIVMPVMMVINNIIISVTAKRIFPQIKAKGEIQKEEKDILYVKVKGLVFQQIGFIILTSSDSIVISAFLGLTQLGIYNNYYYIINALFGFFDVIQAALYPTVGNSMQTESTEKNYENFSFFHFLYILCVIFCSSCMLSLFQPFMKVWVGEGVMFDMPLVVCLVIFFYTYKMSDICSIYRYATGMFEVWKLVPFIAGIFNLVLNLMLTHIIGLYGIVLSTVATMVFVYLPFYCYPVIKNCFKSEKKFWIYIKTQLLYFVCAVIISSVVYFMMDLLVTEGVLGLIIKIVMTTALTGILLLAMTFFSPYRSNSFIMIRRILLKR